MEEADWKDGMNAFRSRVIEQLDGILQVLDILEKEISKEITEIYQSIARIESHLLKLTKKETTP